MVIDIFHSDDDRGGACHEGNPLVLYHRSQLEGELAVTHMSWLWYWTYIVDALRQALCIQGVLK